MAVLTACAHLGSEAQFEIRANSLAYTIAESLALSPYRIPTLCSHLGGGNRKWAADDFSFILIGAGIDSPALLAHNGVIDIDDREKRVEIIPVLTGYNC